jgi:hypothetical protein
VPFDYLRLAADCYSDPGPMFDCGIEGRPSLIRITADIKHAIDLTSVHRPLLDAVVIEYGGQRRCGGPVRPSAKTSETGSP